MLRVVHLFIISLVLLTASPALARAGNGYSFGSRGGRTYLPMPAPRHMNLNVRPIERSFSPRYDPSPSRYAAQTPAAAPAQRGWRSRPLLSGFLGGMLGAGLFGAITGHGINATPHGGLFSLGFLLQLAIIGGVIFWLVRRSRNTLASSASPSNASAFSAHNPSQQSDLSGDDYRYFERLLVAVQAAWSSQNLPLLAQMTTPEMAMYFRDQLAEYKRQGMQNITSSVSFMHGDLIETWTERDQQYASVALQYSMIDVTRNNAGDVVDGSETQPQRVTEAWTFQKSNRGGRWVLSAIQQTTVK